VDHLGREFRTSGTKSIAARSRAVLNEPCRRLPKIPISFVTTSPVADKVDQRSGSGMNSVSSGTGSNRPPFQSSLACSIRSRLEETKFHQILARCLHAGAAEEHRAGAAHGLDRDAVAGVENEQPRPFGAIVGNVDLAVYDVDRSLLMVRVERRHRAGIEHDIGPIGQHPEGALAKPEPSMIRARNPPSSTIGRLSASKCWNDGVVSSCGAGSAIQLLRPSIDCPVFRAASGVRSECAMPRPPS
jgi:hypothetical protein